MRVVRRFLFCIVALLAPAQAAIAADGDLIMDRAFVVDADGSMDIDTVRQHPAQRFEGMLSRGFTASATWIRLTIAASPVQQPGQLLVVRIRPVYLDEISLYDPLDHGGRERRTGDRTDWRASEFKSLHHGFLIPASDRPRDIWLRLQTASTSMIHVQVLTLEDALQANRVQEMGYGLMMGTLALFFLWAVMQWSLRREVLMGAFMASQLMAVLYALFYVGYARIIASGLLNPAAIDLLSCIVYTGYVMVGFVFHFFLLREFRAWKPGLWLVLAAGILPFVAELALIASGEVLPAMRLNITMVAISPLPMLLLSLSCRAWSAGSEDEQPPIPKWMLVGFYALLLGALAIGSSPALGLSQAPEVNLHLYLFHGLMTGVILIVLLQVRAHRIELSRNRAHLRAQSAAQQVEIEKQKAKLQGRFIEMLAHELKTSLSVLHMVFGAPRPSAEMLAHGTRTVNSINQLIDRCLQAEKFEDDEIICHVERVSIDALISEVIGKNPDAARVVIESDRTVTVDTDPQLLKSVLSNLIDNALKYSPAGSTVTLQVSPEERDGRAGCAIVVENAVDTRNGSAGFPEAAQLFRKYYRADGAKKHSGSGLGLYLVANFMRLLGGDVQYQPMETSVRFSLWLPD